MLVDEIDLFQCQFARRHIQLLLRAGRIAILTEQCLKVSGKGCAGCLRLGDRG